MSRPTPPQFHGCFKTDLSLRSGRIHNLRKPLHAVTVCSLNVSPSFSPPTAISLLDVIMCQNKCYTVMGNEKILAGAKAALARCSCVVD